MRVHVVDGTFELYRAHFSPRPGQISPDGRDVKAVAGLVGSLLSLVDGKEPVTHVAVAFDNPIRSFRNDLFAGYKSDEGVPPPLRAQFDLAEDAVRALGIVVWSMDEFEADDALATAAARFSDVAEVRIMSPDKDFGQCLSTGRVVQVDRIRDRVIDETAFRERRGIAPESLPDWLALVGDDSDGIPGIRGYGESTASALLGKFGHLEAIPVDAASWGLSIRGMAALATRLADEREDALLYRRLATLRRDVPLAEDLDALRWQGVPRDRFSTLCDVLGARTLRDRPKHWR
jgi:5'-3' exonuclease